MFKIINASGGYKKTTIIKDISLEIVTGEKVGLLGRNGTGKTTLIKYIMGLIDASEGQMFFDNKAMPSSTVKRAQIGIGYVPQGRQVFPRLTVAENIAVAAIGCGHNVKEEVTKAMDEFPILRPKIKTLAASLSGGQQQILALARALATKPKMLILDEPSEGVQPSILDDFILLLTKINKEKNLTIIIAEQDINFCLSLTDRAYIMDKGTIAKQATKNEILNNKALLKELLGV